MAYNDGLTAEEMIADVSRVLQDDAENAEVIIRSLRWLNRSAMYIYSRHDWPELRVPDATFTTDGSTSYDLSTCLTVGGSAVENFGRIASKSIRIGTNTLSLVGKNQWDQYDPARTEGGESIRASIVKKSDFRILPYNSTGEVVYLDFIGLPLKIEESTTAAQMPYYPERHDLIVEGAVLLALRAKSASEWERQLVRFNKLLAESYAGMSLATRSSGTMRHKKF